MDWIDISLPLRPGMVHWPGDPALRIERIIDLQSGGGYNLSAVHMGLHAGTHIDAPCHFIPGGAGIEAMPLDAVIGKSRVIEVKGPGPIGRRELESQGIRRGQRILIKTRNSTTCYRTDDFCEDYVRLSPDAAHWLAERGTRLVGIDYLSVSGTEDAAEIHSVLMRGGVWILEGLVLSGVQPGPYRLLCLTLKIPGWDGAPARAILQELP